MIFAAITFRKDGLADARACALWLTQSLRDFPCDRFDEAPMAEDWGQAVRVWIDDHACLLGCAAVEEGWRVIIADNLMRGVLAEARARRGAALAHLSSHIESFLRANAEVLEVERELDA